MSRRNCRQRDHRSRRCHRAVRRMPSRVGRRHGDLSSEIQNAGWLCSSGQRRIPRNGRVFLWWAYTDSNRGPSSSIGSAGLLHNVGQTLRRNDVAVRQLQWSPDVDRPERPKHHPVSVLARPPASRYFVAIRRRCPGVWLPVDPSDSVCLMPAPERQFGHTPMVSAVERHGTVPLGMVPDLIGFAVRPLAGAGG